MKRSEMRALLEDAGIRLTRSLGQSFLHDRGVMERMVALADLAPTDRVLEIGPGLGPLTEGLLAAVPEGRVLAIEKDARLAELLRERLAGRPNLDLRVGDALDELRSGATNWEGWLVVSNLPYSVASPMLVELAQAASRPERVVVTLQAEVAERLRAGPGSRDYGVLTLLVQLRYAAGRHFRIPRTSFFPEPNVDSACVRMDRRREPLLMEGPPVRVFERLVRRAFSQRRKMVPKLWRQDWPADPLAEAMAGAGVNPQARAEHITLEQYVALAQALSAGAAGSGRGAAREEIFDVVNDRDEVVGRAPRVQVHREELKHRAVHILVFNAAGQVFLQRRSASKDCHPNVWDSSASGHLDAGEDYDAAAVRELEEELGWRPAAAPERLFRLEAGPPTGEEFVWVYRCSGEGPFRLHPQEISEGRWCSPAELDGWITDRPEDFAPAFVLVWRGWSGTSRAATTS